MPDFANSQARKETGKTQVKCGVKLGQDNMYTAGYYIADCAQHNPCLSRIPLCKQFSLHKHYIHAQGPAYTYCLQHI